MRTEIAAPLRSNLTIASDGGCAPNPGLGGWAYAIFAGQPVEGNELQGADGMPVAGAGFAHISTNNLMELQGLTEALCRLLRKADLGRISPCEVVLHLDSQYALNSFFDWMPGWKARGWHKADSGPVKKLDEMMKLVELKFDMQARGFRFRKNWGRGHSGDYANDLVDRMLTEARTRGATGA